MDAYSYTNTWCARSGNNKGLAMVLSNNVALSIEISLSIYALHQRNIELTELSS